MQLGSHKLQDSAPETPGIHKMYGHESSKGFFPESLSFGQYKDKMLYQRVDGYTTRVFGFGFWDTLSDACGCTSMTPFKLLKFVFRLVFAVCVFYGIICWVYSPGNFDEKQFAMARDLAVLNPKYRGPVFLHLITYTHTGSEFIGKFLDLYQDAFYVHDAMELVYTSVYGITPQFDRILPNNIFFDTDGQFRNLSRVEQGIALWTMDKIFHCKMVDLPTSMLTSTYWSKYSSKQMISTVQYVTCLGNHGVRMDPGHESFKECHEYIKHPICPDAFSSKSGGDRCGRILFANGTFTTKDSDELWNWPDGQHPMLKYRSNFQQYFSCMEKLEEGAKKCAGWHLDGVCRNRQFRIIKTSRANMKLSEKLLRTFPNYRAIHLFRDPRGMTFSRLQSASPYAFAPFESPDAASLAQSYCKLLFMDKITRLHLQDVYFERVIGLFYDKFALDIVGNVEWLVAQLNLKTEKAAFSLDFSRKSAGAVTRDQERWQNGISEQQESTIRDQCSKVMRTMVVCYKDSRCKEYSLED